MRSTLFVGLLATVTFSGLLRTDDIFAFGLQQNACYADTPPIVRGEKTDWHGFDRYDFFMDEKKLTFKPTTATAKEEKGQLRCIVVAPKVAAAGKPWSWNGFYFDHEPQTEIELLKRGFHIGYVQGDAGKPWDAWYAFLTKKHGLSKKPAFVGMSRGGYNAFTWATSNPDKVGCIYADNPVISHESLLKLGELAQNDVPLLHVCGSLDRFLGAHTLAAEGIYQQFGGRISVMTKHGAGHHPHSLRDPTPIADFIERSCQGDGGAAPALVGTKFTKISFYGTEDLVGDFPKEGMHVTCRGPRFSASYDRYEVKPDGITGTLTIVVPKMAAPGKPWVFRSEFVTREAAVDLALLGKGFHIVVGPPLAHDWNAVHNHLIVNGGFSQKPVLEGGGGAAGEVYAWAIANPDKVACIYCENPILGSNMAKTQPLDELTPLAKAGVPVLHVSGSPDPWFEGQTRQVEKRYSELGGSMTIIAKEGEGRNSPAPKDLQPVLDFIIKRAGNSGSSP